MGATRAPVFVGVSRGLQSDILSDIIRRILCQNFRLDDNYDCCLSFSLLLLLGWAADVDDGEEGNGCRYVANINRSSGRSSRPVEKEGERAATKEAVLFT